MKFTAKCSDCAHTSNKIFMDLQRSRNSDALFRRRWHPLQARRKSAVAMGNLALLVYDFSHYEKEKKFNVAIILRTY